MLGKVCSDDLKLAEESPTGKTSVGHKVGKAHFDRRNK
jgi:hypothetical protein